MASALDPQQLDIGHSISDRALEHLSDETLRMLVESARQLEEDGLYDDDGYGREKRTLEDKLANLVAPEISVRLQPNSSVIGMTKKVKTVMEEAAFPNSAAPAAMATNHP